MHKTVQIFRKSLLQKKTNASTKHRDHGLKNFFNNTRITETNLALVSVFRLISVPFSAIDLVWFFLFLAFIFLGKIIVKRSHKKNWWISFLPPSDDQSLRFFGFPTSESFMLLKKSFVYYIVKKIFFQKSSKNIYSYWQRCASQKYNIWHSFLSHDRFKWDICLCAFTFTFNSKPWRKMRGVTSRQTNLSHCYGISLVLCCCCIFAQKRSPNIVPTMARLFVIQSFFVFTVRLREKKKRQDIWRF